jgi:glutamine synthetase
MLFKLAAQALAEARGMVFSMMPKPFADQPGSGMHFHVSLWQGGAACSTRPGAGDAVACWAASSWPACWPMRRRCALARPTVNSYKRLTVGESLTGTTWAPAYVAHGPNNRTALVRTLPGRFEWRLPDASANPYLATASLIAAGLDGIDRGWTPAPTCRTTCSSCRCQHAAGAASACCRRALGEALDALAADA